MVKEEHTLRFAKDNLQAIGSEINIELNCQASIVQCILSVIDDELLPLGTVRDALSGVRDALEHIGEKAAKLVVLTLD